MKPAFFLLLAFAFHADAQYQITCWTSDAGGGQSVGGMYTVTGTIGQPDGNVHSGAAYTLLGGFWNSVVVVQTEGVPLLRIVPNNPQVLLAWPNPSTGFRLQVSPSLSAPVWSDVSDVPALIGVEKQVALPMEAEPRFFRLRKP
jgi:hypothetical protein